MKYIITTFAILLLGVFSAARAQACFGPTCQSVNTCLSLNGDCSGDIIAAHQSITRSDRFFAQINLNNLVSKLNVSPLDQETCFARCDDLLNENENSCIDRYGNPLGATSTVNTTSEEQLNICLEAAREKYKRCLAPMTMLECMR